MLHFCSSRDAYNERKEYKTSADRGLDTNFGYMFLYNYHNRILGHYNRKWNVHVGCD